MRWFDFGVMIFCGTPFVQTTRSTSACFSFPQTKMCYRVGNIFHLVELAGLEFHFCADAVNVVLVVAGVDTLQLHLQPTVLVPTLVA